MNSQYQISYIKEDKNGIEVKARILEGELETISTKENTETKFSKAKVIEIINVKFKSETSREEINKYFNDKLDQDKTRISIWKT